MSQDIFDTRFEGKDVELTSNRVNLDDDIILSDKDPALQNLTVAVGWDSKAFGGQAVDVDISLFLLDKDDMTRKNEDFVFYNQMDTEEGAIKHEGDNRIGAGEGDDETILIDLHGIPYDIFRIIFVYSIYKGAERDQGLGLVKNSYIRIINNNDEHELVRFDLDEHFERNDQSAAIVGSLNRQGPKWHFTPVVEFAEGGLGEIATRYGMNIISQ